MINSRLSTLRKYMSDCGIFAYIIPSSDPHLSEYVPDNWKRREWISGFDGSAGTVVVTNNEACLWTDSRYYLQAEIQLRGSEFILFRDGEFGVPDWQTWLAEQEAQQAEKRTIKQQKKAAKANKKVAKRKTAANKSGGERIPAPLIFYFRVQIIALCYRFAFLPKPRFPFAGIKTNGVNAFGDRIEVQSLRFFGKSGGGVLQFRIR